MPKTPSLRMQPMAATPECKNMDTLAAYRGAALADYIANLPDYECTYPLFSLTASQAATVYSPANFAAIVTRFTSEANTYSASNRALVNLALYLRGLATTWRAATRSRSRRPPRRSPCAPRSASWSKATRCTVRTRWPARPSAEKRSA
ncbi:M9 family metallopeptidase N-terminal domain-containing protein [Massilia sp. H-1]|nr:M9 family metallopeptidase N-terminal domain-containing protein [Massilia sp. H-1]